MRGLMLHLSSKYAGSTVDDSARAVLTGLDRGMCTNCRGIRPFQSSICYRCGCAGPPRLVQVGDIVQGTVRQEAHLAAAGVELVVEPVVRALPSGAERELFLTHVRDLGSNTEVHIPISLRDRHAAILATILSNVADGSDDFHPSN